MECPEENVFVDFVRGELPRRERLSLEGHIDDCEGCAMVMAEMARLFGDDAPPIPEPDLVEDDAELADTDGAFSPSVVTESSGEILADPAAMLPQGATLGRYVVIDKVGSGGMGVVYAAYDPELDRKVALKVLRRPRGAGSHSSGDTQRDRLMREAQAMAKLSHPNVITVHDVGTFEGQVFLAMEFIDGQTLGEWLGEQTRTWREALRVFIAAGRGLAAAHAVGLVHRDFKPDNVLMGRNGRVLVTDFGLARPAAGKTGSFSAVGKVPSMQVLTASLTQTGALVGTPAYMAPEQLSGSRTGPPTDQFSFCVALYEGLYGQRPFPGRTFAELAANIGSGVVAPAPRDVNVPRRIRRALLRGLAVDPEQRFVEMDALLGVLRHDPWRAWRRWGAIVVPAGLLMAGAVAVQSGGLHGGYCDRVHERLEGVWDDERRHAVQEALTATGRPFAANALAVSTRRLDDYAERWMSMQQAACRDEQRGEQPQAVLALRMHCLERRRTELGALTELLVAADDAVVEGAVDAVGRLPRLEPCHDLDVLMHSVPAPPEEPALRQEIERLDRRLAHGQALIAASKFDEAEAEARLVLERVGPTGYRPLEAEALCRLAEALERRGALAEAETTYHRALSAALAAGHAVVMVQASVGLVWLTGAAGRSLDEAERWATHGLAALEPLGAMPELRARIHHGLAVARINHHDFDGADRALDRVFEIREAAFGEDDPSLGSVLSTRGQLMAARGQPARAVEFFSRARVHIEHEYGALHPFVASVSENLAGALVFSGQIERAWPLQRAALEIRESNLGPEHPHVAVSHLNMSNTLERLGRYAESREHAQAAVEIFEGVYGRESLDVADGLTNLASAEEALGNAEPSLRMRQRALAIGLAQLDDRHPKIGAYRHNLGRALAGVDRAAEGEAELRLALSIRAEALGEEHVDTAATRTELAEVLVTHRAQADEAVRLAEKAVQTLGRAAAAKEQVARSRIVLAHALWASSARQDRPRARAMAERARAGYADATGRGLAVATVERWLATHPSVDDDVGADDGAGADSAP